MGQQFCHVKSPKIFRPSYDPSFTTWKEYEAVRETSLDQLCTIYSAYYYIFRFFWNYSNSKVMLKAWDPLENWCYLDSSALNIWFSRLKKLLSLIWVLIEHYYHQGWTLSFAVQSRLKKFWSRIRRMSLHSPLVLNENCLSPLVLIAEITLYHHIY